jgi:hypothetical protein
MSGKMGLIQRISELNYFDEDLFYEDVKELISSRSFDVDLDPEKVYILLFNNRTGFFEKLDVIPLEESRPYSEKHFMVKEKRLVLHKSNLENYMVLFDGKQKKGECTFLKDGTWVQQHMDEYSKVRYFGTG